MLTLLQIRHFVLIDELELEFASGMSVLTGETGAGKSILIDALGLLLGDRADSTIVRQGAEQAELNAVFDIRRLPTVQAWLADHDLVPEDFCHLRRIMTRQGRSRAYINGVLQPLHLIRELGEHLIDIHGQHEHQSLLRRDCQRLWLDAHHPDLLKQVTDSYRHWQHLTQQLMQWRDAESQREARIDWLRYHVQELQTLQLQPDEWVTLQAEHRRLANIGRLLEAGQRALSWLDQDEQGAQPALSRALQELTAAGEWDQQMAPLVELLQSAVIQVQEAVKELRRYLDHLDLDPRHLDRLEQRLASIHTLARKHRISEEALPSRLNQLMAELHHLEHHDQQQADLLLQQAQAQATYHQCASQLRQQRHQMADQLMPQITAAMQELGMRGGQFAIQFTPQKPSAQGLESVEFYVSANPGQPLRPLAKVASGGELSRISLAIQMLASRQAQIPTLIFDEVDTGIGGSIAEVVGRHLRALGTTQQVLCVTHLPQVAACAHHHFKVSKQTTANHTATHISLLDTEQRVVEIARMLGGLAITANTLANAKELLEHVKKAQ